jgi:NH3-dependent NAD+ synthetase
MDLDVAASFDPHGEVERRVALLADTVVTTARRGLVLGISGRVDPAAAGRLCQLASDAAIAALREGGPRPRDAEHEDFLLGNINGQATDDRAVRGCRSVRRSGCGTDHAAEAVKRVLH